MYSTLTHGQHTGVPVDSVSEYLVAPEELVSVPVLEPVPCMQELSDAMGPNVVGELLCVFPGKGSTE